MKTVEVGYAQVSGCTSCYFSLISKTLVLQRRTRSAQQNSAFYCDECSLSHYNGKSVDQLWMPPACLLTASVLLKILTFLLVIVWKSWIIYK